MIEKISVTNFKSHAHTEIELGKVTALVGPNGCGKTSILRAIYCLSETIWRPWDDVFTGEQSPSAIIRDGKGTCEIAATGAGIYQYGDNSNDADGFGWRIAIELHNLGPVFARAKWKWDTEENKYAVLQKGQAINQVVGKEIADSAVNEVVDSIYFQASLEKLKKPYYPETLPLHIMSDGSGLASVLASLKTADDERFTEIEAALRTIVPTVRRVKARRAQMTLHEKKVISVNDTRIPYNEPREVVGDELIFDTTSAKDIPAYGMSDGTLLLLGILTLLWSPSSPGLVLLDDIEQGLHPLAQRQLMSELKKFAKEHDKQILLTSHSPYIVDELEADDVWVMKTDKQGISCYKRLSAHPDAKRALEVLTTGELLGAEGEEWVIGEPAMEAQLHG